MVIPRIDHDMVSLLWVDCDFFSLLSADLAIWALGAPVKPATPAGPTK
jgi:hypothetical protein